MDNKINTEIIEHINSLVTDCTKSENNNVIHITRFETPIGQMYASATEAGICMLEFTDRKMLATELKELMKHNNAKFIAGDSFYFSEIEKELTKYFKGELHNFNVKLDAPGSPFQKRVWNKLQKITFGKTISYKQLAVSLNSPDSVRAVANANGRNRISIIIPCHRVIGEDGSLTGYGGGLHRKKWLLDFESTQNKLF